MSGVFPGAANVEEFWRNLAAGVSSVTEVPRDRGWVLEDFFDPVPQTHGKTYSRHGGFLADIDKFDPLFFGIGPHEAQLMDPSARIFLQEAWRAIEDAGYSPLSEEGRDWGLYFCAKGDYPTVVQRHDPTFLAATDTHTPTRLAYLLNLTGPSLAVDTACSSTLAAIAYACDALAMGHCEVAIAGGGGIYVTPNALVTASQMLLFSPDGECFTFDERANGTVIAEAIGAVILKPLSAAIADEDHIYGVIRGWGTNQDGKTNGATAPSARSQMRLQRSVYRRFGLNPDQIGYVEAHGTGTKLGDPIEVHALTESFRTHTKRENYCALASLKTNIGHPFFGAGVTALIKVLLALKHRQIPPTLNFRRANPMLRLERSPFYVNDQLRDWPVQHGADSRFAAINSFGATGINVHLVIEEFMPSKSSAREASPPEPMEPALCIVPLSAQTQTQLTEVAARLLAFLREDAALTNDAGAISLQRLRDAAYTLQIGRQPLPWRCAVAVSSVRELLDALEGFVAGRPTMSSGRVNSAALRRESSLQRRQEIDRALREREWQTLAEGWVSGANIDWSRLYSDGRKPKRISLPTYPFAKERCWVPLPDDTSPAPTNKEHDVTSTFSPSGIARPGIAPRGITQVGIAELLTQDGPGEFTARFTGAEFFLDHHRLQGQRVLPGVAYLEIARVCLNRHLRREPLDATREMNLVNIVWVQPFVFDEQRSQLHVRIEDVPAQSLGGTGRAFAFEIYRTERGERVLHCRGSAVEQPIPAPAPLNLDALEKDTRVRSISGQHLYPALHRMGFMLGTAHQGVQEIHVGEGQVLGRMECPPDAVGAFVLHPSMLDSALHTAVGLGPLEQSDGERRQSLPFVLEELRIFGPCVRAMWAWIRYSEGSLPTSPVVRLDFDLCDASGKVLVQLRGFTSRVLTKTIGASPARDTQTPSTGASAEAPATSLLLAPVWKKQTVPRQPAARSIPERHVLVMDGGAPNAAALAAECARIHGSDRVGIHVLSGEEIAASYESAVHATFAKVQALIRRANDPKERAHVLLQLVLPQDSAERCLHGLHALLLSAQQENGRFIGQTLEVPDEARAHSIVGWLDENATLNECVHASYTAGERWIKTQELALNTTDTAGRAPWRINGVYVLTGGAGGLARIVARHIVEQAPRAHLWLLGRSELDPPRERDLEDLRQHCALLEYRQVDITNRADLQGVFKEIRARSGEPNGVVHAAGVLRDNYIHKKPADELVEVLRPKVHGLINLDECTAETPLDFFVAFSSMAAPWGNAGQSDYSVANAFMDGYVRRRARAVRIGTRRGRSLAINWPLWRDGGMQIDRAYVELMRHNTGMHVLPSDSGCLALEVALLDPKQHEQLMVLHGDEARLKASLALEPAVIATETATAAAPAPAAAVLELITAAVRQAIVEIVKIPAERVEADVELSQFGLDSISLTRLSTLLNKTYGLKIAPTLFFEYPTLASFASFMAERHADEFARVLVTAPPQPTTPTVDHEVKARISKDDVAPLPRDTAPSSRAHDLAEPIAIIGMSGCFPMARNVDEFWRNLVAGRDCISEIPPDRWDWRAIFGNPHESPNTTPIKWGGFMPGVGDFDAAFFAIAPRDAELMDPVQRLMLTYVWKALEDAGYSAKALAGSNTALFVALQDSGYDELFARAGLSTDLSAVPVSMGPNRASFFLDFHGASETVETACSSSLVALHRAVGELRTRATDVAIAGGIQTILTPTKHISFSKHGVLCEDGRCKTFSSRANGYVRGEGIGMLVLKRLADAEADGDDVYGVIRATAVNHGGRAHSLTAPNAKAQTQLICTALSQAGVTPETVSYVEAHGTGTELGDPVEVNALRAAFEQSAQQSNNSASENRSGGIDARCGLGSVKTHVGHLELAAGVTGVIKVLLQMQHRTLIGNLHFDEPNPMLKLEGSPFFVVARNQPWEAPRDTRGRRLPLRAGVSSFGVGGVNAHVVLEEYASTAAKEAHARNDGMQLAVLSARAEAPLRRQIIDLIDCLTTRAGSSRYVAGNVAYTLQVGRVAMPERFATTFSSTDDLIAQLRGYLDGRPTRCRRGRAEVPPSALATVAADAVTSALHTGRLESVMDCWLAGGEIDWARLHASSGARRVHLPSYPFEMQRCWVTESRGQHRSAILAPEPQSAPPPTTPRPRAPEPASNSEATRAPAAAVRDASAPSRPVQSLAQLQQDLRASLAAAIFMPVENIDLDRAFVDIGVDSIAGVEWILTVNKKYDLAIRVTKIYEFPTLREFAEYVGRELERRDGSVQLTRDPAPPTEIAAAPSRGDEVKRTPDISRVLQAPYGLVVDNVQRLRELSLQAWSVPAPAAGEVTVRVRAAAINFPDTMCVTGLYPTMPEYPFVPGFEVAGEVTAVGPDIRDVAIGDEVIAMTGALMGGHASHVNVPRDSVVTKPANISFEEACCMPVAFGTVHSAFRIAQLAAGDHVLIHTASGGCGLIALQLGRLRGCICYATSSKEWKRELLHELGVEHVLDYKGEFDKEIMKLTGGRGVDVVLNMLSGPAIQRGINCLAPSGRYIELAVQGLKSSGKLDLTRLVDNQSFHSIDMRRLGMRAAGEFAGGYLEDMTRLLRDREIVPIVSRIYPRADIAAAFEYVSRGEHVGKVVISHTNDTFVDCTRDCVRSMNEQRERAAERSRIAIATTLREAAPKTLRTAPPAESSTVPSIETLMREGIAVIGMSGQFPGAPALQDFWNNIVTARDCITEVPRERWGFAPKGPARAPSWLDTYKWMGTLDDVDVFDPLFFNISRKEARLMDPQQRLFLQHCWKCIEDAGYAPSTLSGTRCGVFVGCADGGYGQQPAAAVTAHSMMGTANSILAARISYFLNLRGPCLAIDTACSASLATIVDACNSLVLGASDMVLAGGVCVLSTPSLHSMANDAGMLSQDGRCFTFDRRANGFVPAEGVGVLLLKRLRDAQRDGDLIHGVIRGWGINHDGKTNGMTAPSLSAQSSLQKDVYARFNIDPRTIGFVETHGTGTALGDPIEVEALTEAFRAHTQEVGFCALGSVKSTIGHALHAAGVASALKALLCLQHRIRPPAANFRELNPEISLADSPFVINTRPEAWQAEAGMPRRVAVSSFSYNGTNVHLVIEEPPARVARTRAVDRPQAIVLSARTAKQLDEAVRSLLVHLETHARSESAPSLEEVALTLQLGRDAMEERLGFVASSLDEVVQTLRRFLTGEQSVCQRGSARAGEAAPSQGAGDLLHIVRDWVSGAAIDWRSLHAPGTSRTRLPSYSFAQERYWNTDRTDPDRRTVALPIARPSEPNSDVHAAPLGSLHERFGAMLERISS